MNKLNRNFTSFLVMDKCLPSFGIVRVEDLHYLRTSNRNAKTCRRFISSGFNAYIFDYAKKFMRMADPTSGEPAAPFRVIRDFMLNDDAENYTENDIARVLISPDDSADCETRAVGNACIRMMAACMVMEQESA